MGDIHHPFASPTDGHTIRTYARLELERLQYMMGSFFSVRMEKLKDRVEWYLAVPSLVSPEEWTFAQRYCQLFMPLQLLEDSQ